MGFDTSDTIVAIATPRGRGGIGVVRISGPDAAAITSALLPAHPALVARHATYTRIVDIHGAAIDDVVATRFVAPHSYTGDDTVELSAHGNPVLLDRIVAAAVARGARLARPGEFTLRAFLNGRMDLPQAEAVADLVDAVTPLQARTAFDQLEGTLTRAIASVDAPLFDLIARLEASIDFPDEGYHFVTPEDAAREARAVAASIDALVAGGREGRLIREGALVVLAGRPNTGKSSLFNALAGTERAIVTEIPGTTRDLVTEAIDLNGLAVTLVDTAGMRETVDVVELEGVGRARRAARTADCVVVVIDGAEAMRESDRELIEATEGRPRVIAVNKADLPRASDELPDARIDVSAHTGEGLASLRAAIVDALGAREQLTDAPAVTNARHLALLEDAGAAVLRGAEALAHGAPEELALADLQDARGLLDEVVGRRTADDVLTRIFERFCIGK